MTIQQHINSVKEILELEIRQTTRSIVELQNRLNGLEHLLNETNVFSEKAIDSNLEDIETPY